MSDLDVERYAQRQDREADRLEAIARTYQRTAEQFRRQARAARAISQPKEAGHAE